MTTAELIICRACGDPADDNSYRLCQNCLVERINGAGIVEDDDLFDQVKPPQFFTISRKRACLVCRLVAVCVREICLECRKDLPARLADIEQQQTQHHARFNAAIDELTAAHNTLSKAESDRYGALIAEKANATAHRQLWPAFEARYKATTKLQDGLGRTVRAEIAWEEVQPLHDELARLENAAAAILVVAAGVEWDTV